MVLDVKIKFLTKLDQLGLICEKNVPGVEWDFWFLVGWGDLIKQRHWGSLLVDMRPYDCFILQADIMMRPLESTQPHSPDCMSLSSRKEAMKTWAISRWDINSLLSLNILGFGNCFTK